MRKTLPIVLAAAAVLIAAFVLVFLSAYRGGVSVRVGDTIRLTPPPRLESAPAEPGYTNEQLHAQLQRQGADLGIRGVAQREPEAPEGFLGPRLGAPGTRLQAEAAIRQLGRLRRAVDSQKKSPVPLEGRTVPLLSDLKPSGRAVGDELPAPAPESRPSGEAVRAAPGLWTGSFGAAQEGTFTISDEKSWERAWGDFSAAPPPVVDFTRWRIAAVFLGHRPSGGYRVEIDADPEVGPTEVSIGYREIAPEPGRTPPEGATAPYALRLLPRSDLPVRFRKRS